MSEEEEYTDEEVEEDEEEEEVPPIKVEEKAQTERKGSTAERKGSVTDRKGSAGSVTDRKGSVTDRKGSVTDRKGSITDRKGSVTDRKGSITDRKGSVTDRKGSATEVSPALAKEEQPKLRHVPPPQQKEAEPEEQTEAEKAMLAAKKRHEEEEAAKLLDFEEKRRQEKDQMDRELVELRERQVKRKEEQKQMEAEMAARRRQDEERRRQEEEERKAKSEANKAKREEEKRKRQNMMAGAFVGGFGEEKPTGRNFVVQKREEGSDALGQNAESGGGPKLRGGPNKAQHQEAKRNYMSIVNRPVDVSNMLPNDIKAKIKQLHARIVKLEGEKYDLEKRKDRQEYDLKELSERQKQHARAKALETGADPTEVESSGNFPPKVRVASRFDRQTDLRGYGQRRDLFEHPAETPEPKIVHGSGRPPPEWGRKEFEELENIRKNLEPPKYVEQVKAEGDAAKPPVPVIPLQLPADDGQAAAAPAEAAAPPPPEKPRRGIKA
ncbi:hypothetical protein niasHS_006618 [Heterodera schachtii]|uniref:Troponin T n=1 Tax=Heterodera schachtii TaxID=97005 RepID=A0ABD2JHT2_HETSC